MTIVRVWATSKLRPIASRLIFLLPLTLAGFTPTAEGGRDDWKRYDDPSHQFVIEYPDLARPAASTESKPGLLSAAAFDFEHPFRLRFQISVWDNPDNLSVALWATQHINERLPAAIHPVEIAGRRGLMVRTTNLSWPIVKTFVAGDRSMYELSYTDFTSRVPGDARTRWNAILARMMASFRILSDESR